MKVTSRRLAKIAGKYLSLLDDDHLILAVDIKGKLFKMRGSEIRAMAASVLSQTEKPTNFFVPRAFRLLTLFGSCRLLVIAQGKAEGEEMTKQLTSAEAAAIVYGKPGTKVIDKEGREVWVSSGSGDLICANLYSSGALRSSHAPFTLPSDPDELPEDVAEIARDWSPGFNEALQNLWKHIKPEAKR